MRKDRQVEILAPAGSFACFQAAMNAGADAVYAAGARFGARAYANNFTQDELIEAIERAHIYGKKFYLTVNTLLKDHEIAELYDYLAPLYEKGLDAVIVQDTGVFQFIRSNFPDLDIHASTQMTITGAAGAKFLESQGAARVVPARELSLEEVRQIHETTDLEVECFVHGALCYCYSGQCLMSSVIGGRSGNRGQCAQPCRLPYTVDGQKKYFLSLKDICTLELIPELVEAGIDSFKIEGRMKKPEYVAAVTAMYRKYLDFLFEKGPANYHVTEKDKKYLLDLFNRGGSCTGYYQMGNGPQMMAFTNEKKTGEVFLETKQLKEKITGELHLVPGSPVLLHVSCQGEDAYECVGEVQYAKSQPVTEERVRQQMDKLGNTSFIWEKLEIYMENSVFVPMKILNEARHQALEDLKEKLLQKYRRNVGDERVKRIAEETQAKISAIAA